MTSLDCWIGVDQRGPASAYLVSDSRVTWDRPDQRWDVCRKLYVSPSSADAWGLAGDLLFPVLALGDLLAAISGERILRDADARERIRRVRRFLEHRSESYPLSQRRGFRIVHLAREGEGMECGFHIATCGMSAAWHWEESEFPTPKISQVVLSLGSGGGGVEQRVASWNRAIGVPTSRAVFSGFCDELRAGKDPRSGGAPQLVGVYREGPVREFGVAIDGARFIRGMQLSPDSDLERFEWRDNLFQRVDIRTGQLLDGAQAQPRPRDL